MALLRASVPSAQRSVRKGNPRFTYGPKCGIDCAHRDPRTWTVAPHIHRREGNHGQGERETGRQAGEDQGSPSQEGGPRQGRRSIVQPFGRRKARDSAAVASAAARGTASLTQKHAVAGGT